MVRVLTIDVVGLPVTGSTEPAWIITFLMSKNCSVARSLLSNVPATVLVSAPATNADCASGSTLLPGGLM